MIQKVEMYNSMVPQQQRITVSVEIEKTREPLYQLFSHGDVVRVFVRTRLINLNININKCNENVLCLRCLSVKMSLVTSAF